MASKNTFRLIAMEYLEFSDGESFRPRTGFFGDCWYLANARPFMWSIHGSFSYVL